MANDELTLLLELRAIQRGQKFLCQFARSAFVGFAYGYM